MQRSRSRKLAKLARQTTVRPPEPRFARLVRHASIGAAVVASISAARAQQADFVSMAQAQQSTATDTAAPAAPGTTTSADQGGGLQEVIVTRDQALREYSEHPNHHHGGHRRES